MKTDIEILAEVTGYPKEKIEECGEEDWLVSVSEALTALATLRSQMQERIDELQTAYDKLTGEKFSDRTHAALHSRIAELEKTIAGYIDYEKARQAGY